jgi:transposase InsO family protein
VRGQIVQLALDEPEPACASYRKLNLSKFEDPMQLEKDLPVSLFTHPAHLVAYIEGYYNRQRLHSAVGYIFPEQAERQAA